MIAPRFPDNERERLEAVKSYKLLDTLPEKDYDNITSLIAAICDTPISLVTLLDKERNFLKSHLGVPFSESPRTISFCGHAILEDKEIFVIEDAREDDRFRDNPLVKEHNAIFYAGVPLVNDDNYSLGTLCVYDTKPRRLNDHQIKAMIKLGSQVVNLFELHKKNSLLLQSQEQLEERNKQLKDFAGIVSHDLKSPLATITSLVYLLKEEYGSVFNEEGNQYVAYIEESSDALRDYIDGMLNYYKSDKILQHSKEEVKLQNIYRQIDAIMFVDRAEFKHPEIDTSVFINKTAIVQIFMNLIGNALKYNHSEVPYVETTFSEDAAFYYFAVKDNGIGIEKERQETIFNLFNRSDHKDRQGNTGSGIGLAVVKKLIHKLGGEIILKSAVGQGSIFSFTIKK
ncbi:ATP-binding protein [Dokdonia sp.]|uniref:sensor histidine kinase n=1 Tax=Dokdonia sp. TaxID=2024995 RepID=UPI0032635C96